MKKGLLMLGVATFFCVTAFSQSFHIGIKAGANLYKIDGQPFSNEFTYGYHAGVFAEVGLGEKWTLSPEVLFSQVNVDTANKFSSVYSFNGIGHIQLNYVSVPVLVQYKLSKGLALEAGPQFGLLADQTKNVIQKVSEAFTKGDVSLLGGVQVKILGLRVYGRYVLGINNLNNTGNSDVWKNHGFQVGIGYAIL